MITLCLVVVKDWNDEALITFARQTRRYFTGWKKGRLWNTRDGSKRVFPGKRAPARSPVCKLWAVSVAVVEAGRESDPVE